MRGGSGVVKYVTDSVQNLIDFIINQLGSSGSYCGCYKIPLIKNISDLNYVISEMY